MSPPRLIVITKPPPAVLDGMQQALRDVGLDKRLGSARFDPENWHQSLSDRYPDQPEIRDALLRACTKVSTERVERFSLALSKISGPPSEFGPIYWAFRASGPLKGLRALQLAIQSATEMEGIASQVRSTAHVTISYRAPSPLDVVSIAPIIWPIDEFLLVKGGGNPYHYEELGRWQLIEPSGRQLYLL